MRPSPHSWWRRCSSRETLPILAPLTALLVVEITLKDIVTSGVQRVASVTAGVLLAVAFSAVVGLSWWSLGALVAVSIMIGQLLRLGPHMLEVPISAMLVLAVGGAEAAATDRIMETLIGAAVGVAVNVIFPPAIRAGTAAERGPPVRHGAVQAAEHGGRRAPRSDHHGPGRRGGWTTPAT